MYVWREREKDRTLSLQDWVEATHTYKYMYIYIYIFFFCGWPGTPSGETLQTAQGPTNWIRCKAMDRSWGPKSGRQDSGIGFFEDLHQMEGNTHATESQLMENRQRVPSRQHQKETKCRANMCTGRQHRLSKLIPNARDATRSVSTTIQSEHSPLAVTMTAAWQQDGPPGKIPRTCNPNPHEPAKWMKCARQQSAESAPRKKWKLNDPTPDHPAHEERKSQEMNNGKGGRGPCMRGHKRGNNHTAAEPYQSRRQQQRPAPDRETTQGQSGGNVPEVLWHAGQSNWKQQVAAAEQGEKEEGRKEERTYIYIDMYIHRHSWAGQACWTSGHP